MSSEHIATTAAHGQALPRKTRPIVSAGARGQRDEARWETWSTSVVLRLAAPRGLNAARIAVEQELDAIDLACSRFRADSEIARINASAGRVVRVSPLLAEALALAIRAAQLTDGDVDPTVGSALKLAGYDRDWRMLEHLPEDTSPGDLQLGKPPFSPIVLARTVCGWRSVAFDGAARTVRVPRGFEIDLGATAKAWAADRAAHAAAQAAGCGALVAIGGDIATSGIAPTSGWAVYVTEDHRSDQRAPGQAITIRSGGLATSSTTTRRWRHRGRTMHHIIDPATGAPALKAWRTVSVAAASCADANIATTSALVRGGGATAWLARMGVPARLVGENGRVYTVGSWPAERGRTRVPAAPQTGSRPVDFTSRRTSEPQDRR
ncbi:MAG TPA: FAD:protein FMN transferase [Solirubrobacteraceae bacterium]